MDRMGKMLLGLGLALTLTATAAAELTPKPAFYSVGEFGARSVSNADANKYFDASSVGFSRPTFPASFVPVVDWAIGYQTSSLFGIEAGGSYGPSRSFDVTYNVSNSPFLKVNSTWRTYSVYAMPVLRFWNERGLWNSPSFHTIGLRTGLGILDGTLDSTLQSNGKTGKYRLSAAAPAIGLVYRFQQMIGRKINLGIEIAYDYEAFSNITNTEGSGLYVNVTSPETNPDGSKTTIDVSGVSLKLILGGWFNLPYTKR